MDVHTNVTKVDNRSLVLAMNRKWNAQLTLFWKVLYLNARARLLGIVCLIAVLYIPSTIYGHEHPLVTSTRVNNK